MQVFSTVTFLESTVGYVGAVLFDDSYRVVVSVLFRILLLNYLTSAYKGGEMFRSTDESVTRVATPGPQRAPTRPHAHGSHLLT